MTYFKRSPETEHFQSGETQTVRDGAVNISDVQCQQEFAFQCDALQSLNSRVLLTKCNALINPSF